MRRLFGLETEYGIQVDGVEDMDVVVESMELIRCYLKEDFVARWDYRLENARRDMRGFEVDELLNDQDETVHLQRDRQRQIPLGDLKSDLIISNGARLYNDHTHPEYSTPECHSLFDLVALDRAGERILRHCARRRSATRKGGGVVRLYKNNTDFVEHSYGCHENFLLPRQLPFQQVIEGLVPFLVTRQVWAGAGKVGVECAPQARQSTYQLSQRADFFETLASVDTMTRRPLVNTRDEPHANADQYRRLHLIVGDANMCEWATALKVGACALVLDLLEAGALPRWELADPLAAIKEISRDETRQWALALAGDRHSSALEVQRSYLEAAIRLAAGRDAETDWVLAQWGEALEALGRDPLDLLGRCDWVTKKWLLDAFAEAEGLDWQHPDHRAWLQSQDLEYSNIDPEEGLYLLLEAQDQVTRLVEEEEVMRGMTCPPADTRAYFRGRCLEKFGPAVRSLNWDSIEFLVQGRTRVVDLKACVDSGVAAYYNQVLDSAPSVEALLEKLPTSA
ncbi:MAG: proteasome accessory factor PafA2 family protein [Candidatus Latescibacteria bacterium]|nr:proteasome accessory factor PafA2 family protein [Candidatus Latescibacterota bacterium]